MTGKHRSPDWPPSAPGDPGWAGDTPWAGGQPPPEGPRGDGIDALDPRFPIRRAAPPHIFWHLIRHPPVKARWRPHLDFTADETVRAVVVETVDVESFVVPFDDTAPVPVIRVPVARVPYPELEPATLAHEFEDTFASEFTEDDQRELTVALDRDGGYLP